MPSDGEAKDAPENIPNIEGELKVWHDMNQNGKY
jgi:hypothetical protein